MDESSLAASSSSIPEYNIYEDNIINEATNPEKNDDWLININNSEHLIQIVEILNLLQTNPSSPELYELLVKFLSPLINNEEQLKIIVNSLTDDKEYTESFITGMNRSIERYSLRLQSLPKELLWRILSNLNILSLRAIYSSSKFMHDEMNNLDFIKLLCRIHKLACDDFLLAPDDDNIELFPRFVSFFSKHKYDPQYCDTDDGPILTDCIINAIRENLYDTVEEILKRVSDKNIEDFYKNTKNNMNKKPQFPGKMPKKKLGTH